MPAVCFQPSDDQQSHGNFLTQSYRAIIANRLWQQRLWKVHTSARSALPRVERRWRELDTCTSSDALLMNIFCYPGLRRDGRLFRFLGAEQDTHPEFGVRVRVPLQNGRGDRTEVDMRIGALIVEAKLTESDFQSREESKLAHYRDFEMVFDVDSLPRNDDALLGYQLIRNVLAAHASGAAFCLLCDARRPDLQEQWYAISRCIRPAELRVRCKMATWQEIAQFVPRPLARFLAEKYGICSGMTRVAALADSAADEDVRTVWARTR
jgi:hypothetical protein